MVSGEGLALFTRSFARGKGYSDQTAADQCTLCCSAEDPHVFFDEVHHDVLRMICHGGNNSANPPTLSGHYFSTTFGRSWTQAGHLPPYSHNFSWSNGTLQPLARRERPSMALDPKTGRPVALVNGVLNLNSPPACTDKPAPCPAHKGKSFCPTSPDKHQCDKPPPTACPPCPPPPPLVAKRSRGEAYSLVVPIKQGSSAAMPLATDDFGAYGMRV
eukprot:SAG11_NODE_850_length_6868_cov_3.543523_1_plen_216_part_00